MIPLITRAWLRDKGACYSDQQLELVPEAGATLLQVLQHEATPVADRVWVAVRALPEREARLFAVRCARRALGRRHNPDPRSLAACDVAERFANGEATAEELRVARSAASAASAAAAAAAAYASYAASAAAYAADAAASAAASASYAAAADERREQLADLIRIVEATHGDS